MRFWTQLAEISLWVKFEPGWARSDEGPARWGIRVIFADQYGPRTPAEPQSFWGDIFVPVKKQPEPKMVPTQKWSFCRTRRRGVWGGCHRSFQGLFIWSYMCRSKWTVPGSCGDTPPKPPCGVSGKMTTFAWSPFLVPPIFFTKSRKARSQKWFRLRGGNVGPQVENVRPGWSERSKKAR